MRMPIDIPLGADREVGMAATRAEVDAENRCLILSYPNTPDGRPTTLRIQLTEAALDGLLSNDARLAELRPPK